MSEPSSDTCQTHTTVDLQSPDCNQDRLADMISVPPTKQPSDYKASNGVCLVQPSVKKMHVRPLSVHQRRHLIVKGFCFEQKWKKLSDVSPGCVQDDGSAQSPVSSETVMPRDEVIAELSATGTSNSTGTALVRKRGRPRKILSDGSLLYNDNTLMMSKCGQQEEDECCTGNTAGTHHVVENSANKDAIIVRKRGRPRKVHLDGASASDKSKLLMRNCVSVGDSVKIAVAKRRGRLVKRLLCRAPVSAARRRGRPRKILSDGSLLNNVNTSMIRKCGQQQDEFCTGNTAGTHHVVGYSANTDAVVVRKRGRPRKVHLDGASVTDKSKLLMRNCVSVEDSLKIAVAKRRGRLVKRLLSRAPVSAARRRGRPRKIPVDVPHGPDDQKQHYSGKDTGPTDRLGTAYEIGANTAVRKRGRPRKRPVVGPVQQHGDANASAVRRRGRPRKRPESDVSASPSATEKCCRHEHQNCT